jgi:hypothetical protein
VQPTDCKTITQVNVDGTMLDAEATFCYQGDMLCAGGGCGSVVAAILPSPSCQQFPAYMPLHGE